MIMKPGNIWSGDRERAVLTNPTVLAKRKGNLRGDYSIVVDGVRYADVEEYYQRNKVGINLADFEALKDIVIRGIVCKLEQYPRILKVIDDSGGENFIAACSHIVTGRSRWEGKGIESGFIECLLRAYKIVKER